MHPHQFQDLLEKFSRGLCSPEEEQLIADWYNRIGQGEKTTFEDAQKTQVQEKLWSAINPQPARKTRTSRFSRAAIIVLPLLAGVFLFLQRQYRPADQVATGPANHSIEYKEPVIQNDGHTARAIALPDGSKVLLEPGSELIVGESYGQTTRELRLKGEAFFDVRRDAARPFVVYSNEVVTKVLGTSFTVRAYESDGEITVAVKTGKVSVYTNTKQREREGVRDAPEYREVILTPNQQMVYHRDREEVFKQLVEKPEVILPDSKLFRMQFENESVGRIFEVLQENYGIEIRYDQALLNNCRLTTSMSDEGLYERIEVICKAIGASYVIDRDAAITIKSNGC